MLNRLATTSTTREASGTCTVGCEYSGAIFTAVCCGLVVAPPISSGSVMWRRSISVATNTISSSDGVISPLRPTMSALWSTAACRILSVGTITPRSIDLVVVAAEHDADDVLADVVDVALDGGDHELALRLARAAGRLERQLLGFHERLEIGDGALHGARALHHLRQEHLAGAEQLADHLHAVHQRPFDHQQRPAVLRARFLGVLLDEVDHAVHERVRQPRLDRALAPLQIGLALGRACP